MAMAMQLPDTKNDVRTWQVTINCNKMADEEGLIAAKYQEVFTNWYQNVVHFLEPGQEGAIYDPSKIEEVECVSWRLEIGGKYKRLHLHAMVRVIGFTNCRIDLDKTRKWISEAFGSPCVFNAIYFDDQAYKVKRYIEKGDKILSFGAKSKYYNPVKNSK